MSVRSYRERMRAYSETDVLDIWYAWIDDSMIEQMLPQQRLQQLQNCIPDAREQGLRQAFYAAALLGYDVCAAVAHSYDVPWPQALAERVISIVRPQ